MNRLAIDYGTTRIGVALATGPLAEPLGVIANSQKASATHVVTQQALQHILTLIREHQIEEIVIGISEGAMANKSKEFAAALASLSDVPQVFVDETLSSVTAEGYLHGKSKTKRRGHKDHIAATIFLQEYLDTR